MKKKKTRNKKWCQIIIKNHSEHYDNDSNVEWNFQHAMTIIGADVIHVSKCKIKQKKKKKQKSVYALYFITKVKIAFYMSL